MTPATANNTPLPMRIDFRSRLLMFIFISLVCVLIASLLMAVVLGSEGAASTPRLRIATVIQDIFCFIVPAIGLSVVSTALPARFLGIDKGFDMTQLLLAVAVMLFSIPLMNVIVEWNANLTLPESLAGFEAWAKAAEERAAGSVRVMLGADTAGSTIASILIVGVLAGLSEELYFRGALQRLLATGPLGAHTAVWVTATLFSLMHMQFYGLVPRILLGALFGYLFLWTGSIWLPVIIHALNNSIYILSYRNPSAGIDRFGTGDIWLALASAIICFFLLRTLYRRSTSGRLTKKSPV